VTVIPNIAINLCSILRGGNWRLSLGKHWPVAVYVVIGSIAGTHLLIYCNPDLLKLLLAGMILFYLNMARLKRIQANWIFKYPKSADAGFGLISGVLSGTTNISAPPLIIYFNMLNLAPVAMVQTLNFCFILSKASQLITFGIAGEVSLALMLGGLILALFSGGFLVLGMHVQGKMKVETYRFWLNKMLLFIAIILILQSLISLYQAPLSH
jgi:uncharacterized membrane protein YfcA